MIEARLSLGPLVFRRGVRHLGEAVLFNAPRNGDADERHQPADQRERQKRQPGNDAKHRHCQCREKESVGIAAQLVDDRLVGRAARASLGDEEAGGERNDERRNLRHQTVADRKLGENVGGGGKRQAVPGNADNDAPEDVDGENGEAGDCVATDEFRRAVH